MSLFVSAYLFILCLEILFTIAKNKKDIESLKIHGNTFLYTAYADDTTFFLKKFGFNKRIVEYNFFIFIVFRFKSKLIKMRSSQDMATGVKVPVCGIKCIDLTKSYFRR